MRKWSQTVISMYMYARQKRSEKIFPNCTVIDRVLCNPLSLQHLLSECLYCHETKLPDIYLSIGRSRRHQKLHTQNKNYWCLDVPNYCMKCGKCKCSTHAKSRHVTI